MFETAFLLLGLALGGEGPAYKHSRAESPPGISASNTVGPGDIWLSAGTEAVFDTDKVKRASLSGLVDSAYRADYLLEAGEGEATSRSFRLLPVLKAGVGLASFVDLEVESIPFDGEKLGAAGARLRVTPPGNDHLRLLGFALCFGAVLSTEEDSYLRNMRTPGFDPLPYFSVLADLDLLKAFPQRPYKFYAGYRNLDDYKLARRYLQHRFDFAAERKSPRGGFFAQGAALLYRGRGEGAPAGAVPPLFEMSLGARRFLGANLALAADLSFDPQSPFGFYRDEKKKPPRLRLHFEMPLLFQETRTEALRALLFHEHHRAEGKARVAAAPRGREAGKTAGEGSPAEPRPEAALSGVLEEGLVGEILGEEEAEAQRRRDVRTEMKEIEEMLQ